MKPPALLIIVLMACLLVIPMACSYMKVQAGLQTLERLGNGSPEAMMAELVDKPFKATFAHLWGTFSSSEKTIISKK